MNTYSKNPIRNVLVCVAIISAGILAASSIRHRFSDSTNVVAKVASNAGSESVSELMKAETVLRIVAENINLAWQRTHLVAEARLREGGAGSATDALREYTKFMASCDTRSAAGAYFGKLAAAEADKLLPAVTEEYRYPDAFKASVKSADLGLTGG